MTEVLALVIALCALCAFVLLIELRYAKKLREGCLSRIAMLKEEYGFQENDEPANDWGDAKQRGFGRLCELMSFRDRL